MQRRNVLQMFVLLLLALLYVGLTQKYRAYDADNPWWLSFSYNACHGGGELDTFVGVPYPSAMEGVHLFGKMPAGIQCAVFNQAGWMPGSVVCLNLVFGITSLWMWWSFLRRLGYRENWIAVFILMLGVTEPVVAMMEKARYEFFTFFLLSLALWLGVQGWEFLTVLVALMATETHPFAITVPIVVILLLAIRTRNWKMLTLKVAVSGCLALAFYFHLHPHALEVMSRGAHPFNSYVPGGILYAYFVERRRHLPELVFLLLGSWLYWKHRSEVRDTPVKWLALMVGALLFVQPHLNAAYAIYAMPFFLWVALEGYDLARKWLWVPGLVLLGILAQYGYLYKVNLHEGFRRQEFAAVQQGITESEATLGIADSQVRLCGDYSLWFAHPQNYKTCQVRWEEKELRSADIYLCFDGPLQPNGLSATEWLSCADTNEMVPLRELSSINLRGHLLHIETRR